ncbi:MAG: VOC family protein [Cellvibrionaceae bacterium]
MRRPFILTFLTALHLLAGSASAAGEPAHFHHVRLNVTDVSASRQFYQKVFGATPVQFNNKTPGLFTERSFILMNEVDQAPLSNLKTSIWHIGWGGVDGPNEYAWWKNQGVEFYTPVTELGSNHYMYLYGPDREIVEIYTGGKHHRFNHVHFLATRTEETANWLMRNLNLPAEANREITNGNIILIDNVQMIVYPNIDRYRPEEQGEEFMPTGNSVIAHLAFSFRDLEAAYQRIKSLETNIVAPITVSEKHGLPSFFARAPDGILVEFVEAKPIPEGIWE